MLNFHAVIFEYHRFLFQFWKGIYLSSKNIFDNLVREGFRPQFYYHCRGTKYLFIERDFVYLFKHVGCVTYTDWDSNPDLCDAGAELHQLSYRRYS